MGSSLWYNCWSVDWCVGIPLCFEETANKYRLWILVQTYWSRAAELGPGMFNRWSGPSHAQPKHKSSLVQPSLLPVENTKAPTGEVTWKWKESESHSVVPDSLRPHGLYSLWNSIGQNTGVGSLSLLQGIFPTQGLNQGFLHCNWVQSLSHVWLCDPMDRSMPGLPVYHQLPEPAQMHVHQVGDAIQPSSPLSFPSPPTFNVSQHQSLFQWVSSPHQVTKVLEFQLQHQSFQWIFRPDFLWDWLSWPPCSPRDAQESSPTPQFKTHTTLQADSLPAELSGTCQVHIINGQQRT